MNANEGAYQLSHLYDQLIQRASTDNDITKTRSRSAITTAWENILIGCETSLLKIVSVDFSRELIIYLVQNLLFCWLHFCVSSLLHIGAYYVEARKNSRSDLTCYYCSSYYATSEAVTSEPENCSPGNFDPTAATVQVVSCSGGRCVVSIMLHVN